MQTHSEKRKQVPSFSSTAHDLNLALVTRDQDPLSHLASHSAALERPPPERDKLTTSADLITSYLLAKAKRHSIKRGILTTHQEGTDYLVSKGYTAMSKYLSNNAIYRLFEQLLNGEVVFISDYKIDINNKAIDELICEYSIKLKTPRIDTETTLEFFQRLSIIAFYEPLSLEPYKDEPFFAWLERAEKFFPHGSIAYLLYLDRKIASHSLAPDSPRGDIPVAQAPSPPSYRTPDFLFPGRKKASSQFRRFLSCLPSIEPHVS